jgi:outer membrane protein OmpA-like peptidoglycan-associated protein
LLNLFRVTSKLDATLDIRGAMVDDQFDAEIGGRRQEGLLSVDLGLSYRFGRSVSRPEVALLTAAELAELNDRVNQINRENAALRDELTSAAARSSKTKVEKIVEWKDVAADIYIRFELGKSELSKEARVQLSFLADLLKTYKEGSYTITGYADAVTGSAEINARLSWARAEEVKKCLVKEFGVKSSRLEIVAAGGVGTQYYNDPALSRSVVIRPNR